MINFNKRWHIIIAGVLLTGCAVGPIYERPPVELPHGWMANTIDARLPASDWWTAFQDPVLDRLVTDALASNHDLKAATERVVQARALAQVANAALYPNISTGAQTGWQKRPVNDPNGKSGAPASRFEAGITASYELDLFGLNSSKAQAATAQLKGSEADRNAVALSVAAIAASSYFQLCALDARLAVAQETHANALKTLRLIRAQQQAGMATMLQMAQQQTEIATLEAAIPTLKTARTQTLNALATLVGRLPDSWNIEPTEITRLKTPEIPAGLPSDLIERRPDVLRAEALLIGANADVRAAIAALFPRIELTAQGGYASLALRQLLEPGSTLYNLAAGMIAPIFEGGRLRGQIAYAEARFGELAQNYQQAVLIAFKDVANALSAQHNTNGTLAAQTEALAQAGVASRLAKLQYEQGMGDYLSVLATERSLLSARDFEAQARFARLNAAVSIYQALGVGHALSTGR